MPENTCTCDHCRHLRRHQPQYKDLRLPDGRYVGRYDPARGVLEVPCGGRNKHYFDLALLSPVDVLADVCNNDCHDGN